MHFHLILHHSGTFTRYSSVSHFTSGTSGEIESRSKELITDKLKLLNCNYLPLLKLKQDNNVMTDTTTSNTFSG